MVAEVVGTKMGIEVAGHNKLWITAKTTLGLVGLDAVAHDG